MKEGEIVTLIAEWKEMTTEFSWYRIKGSFGEGWVYGEVLMSATQ